MKIKYTKADIAWWLGALFIVGGLLLLWLVIFFRLDIAENRAECARALLVVGAAWAVMETYAQRRMQYEADKNLRKDADEK